MTTEQMHREKDRQNRIWDESCKACRYRMELSDGTKVYSGNKCKCMTVPNFAEIDSKNARKEYIFLLTDKKRLTTNKFVEGREKG